MKKVILISVLILLISQGLLSSPVLGSIKYYINNIVSSLPVNDPPVALNVSILGDPRSGLTLYGTYFYSDAEADPEGTSTYQWFTSNYPDGSDSVEITGADSPSYKLTDNELNKYIGFSVTPVPESGSGPGIAVTTLIWVGPVINAPPVAGSLSITGSKMVNGVLTGHYEYYDTEGDPEEGSVYKWYSSDTEFGSYSEIIFENEIIHIIRMDEQGRFFKFEVTPGAKSGIKTGNKILSQAYGPVNTKPYADNVIIAGVPVVDNTLTASYQYHDVDLDKEGISGYQWYRELIAIPGANSETYKLTIEDVDKQIRFQVIPVSETGYPDTGDPALSSFTAVVSDPSDLPVADEVCISGVRETGEELTGKYHYVNTYKEKNSRYVWLRDNDTIQSGTLAGLMKYTLKSGDIDHEIRFAVIPRNTRSQKGSIAISNPLAIFTLARETYSVTDPDLILTADPANGVFWGEGVSNGIFSPSSVDSARSPITIYYDLTLNNPNTTCLQRATKDLYVKGINMYFDSFRDTYCQNGGYDTIIVRNVPALASLKLFKITDPDAVVSQPDETTIIIDPAKMRAGNKEDTLYFMAMDGLSLIKISRPFVIDSLSQVTILNLPPASVYCNNLAPFELFVSQPGGIFEGPVVNGFFDPSGAVGNTLVKYTYTTKHGCTSIANVPVTINPSPVISFHLADTCINGSSDSTRFINTTISGDAVNTWLWEFPEPGGSSTRNIKNPAYLYTSGGLHRVTLTATTVNNCISGKDIIIDIGVKPAADFFWENECYHTNDSLLLFDATSFTSRIISRSWNFFDGDSLHTVKNPKYPKKTTGYLPVEYIVRTNYPGCSDTVTKQIFIRPTISLADDDYFEDFENGNGGWIKDYGIINSWTFGKPDRIHINRAASGDNAWFTRYNLTDQKIESSSIISPCFDFTSIQRPMISLKLWNRFDRNRDGAALQYMIGDSGQWIYVGSLDDGINWYNSSLIKGKPGGDQIGWTTLNRADTGWIEAQHTLDELTGKKDVKLRIAYGSDGTSQDNDGIAFDDIWIGPRSRGVLIEHFTNNSSRTSSYATEMVSDLAKRDTADIINIQYHTNFPGSDPYYNDNPGDASARFLFYGLARAPYTFIDGGTKKEYSNIYDYLTAEIDSNDIEKRSLISPSFNIELNTLVSGGVLTVSGRIKALKEMNVENVTLYLAVTEKKNNAHTGALGETEFFNIFRKFIPDAGGINLTRNWNKDQEHILTERTWIIEKIADNSDIEIIAFIQNNITKEIYQAVSDFKHNIIAGKKDQGKAVSEGKSFGLYPNPAFSNLTVMFEEMTDSQTDILIYDFSGLLVRTYKTGTGITEYNISDLNLKSGIYLVKVFVKGFNVCNKKLVVSNN